MSDTGPDKVVEQRSKPRCDVVGVATLDLDGARIGPCLVINISASGVLICAPSRLDPGTCCDIELELQGCPRTQGRVQILRCDSRRPNEHYLGMRFESISHHDAAVVDQLVRDVVRRRQKPEVLIVDRSAQIRDELRRDLRSLGHGSVAVSNPLDAAMCLNDRHLSFASAMVGLRIGAASGLEMVELMAETCPTVGRILIGDFLEVQKLSISRSGRWAHALLARPWNRTTLVGVLKKVFT